MIRTSMLAAALALGLSAPVWAQGAPQTVAQAQVNPQTIQTGFRASKIIGQSVYNETDYSIASVDDLIITPNDSIAVLSVGSTLGLGGKLVAVPFKALQLTKDKVYLHGVTEERLKSMPEFTYKKD